MKLICEITIAGEEQVVMLTTAAAMDQGALVKTKPGVGKPFWMFTSVVIPTGMKIATCDFTDAPIVSANVADNNAAITAMLAVNTSPPEGLLTFIER